VATAVIEVTWMTAICLGAWWAAAWIAPAHAAAIFFGMLGPLVAVAGTWLVVVRTARVNPAGMTAVMMAGFAVKLVFFGAYVVAVVRFAGVEAVPFVTSFVVYLITLYAIEARLLQRLSGRLT
jgi:hypothetical protein